MALLYDTNIHANDLYDSDSEQENNLFDDGDDGDEDIIESPARHSSFNPGINICQQRPPYSNGRNSYTTCGLRCARILEELKSSIPQTHPQKLRPQDGQGARRIDNYRSPLRVLSPSGSFKRRDATTRDDLSSGLRPIYFQKASSLKRGVTRRTKTLPCVVCSVGHCRDDRYVTCGTACAEVLCKTGPANPNMCNYCHRRPKNTGYDQCGATCMKLAKVACLLCKTRPKFQQYHLCGRTCKMIATKSTPLLLEAPAGHTTYEFVKKKFEDSWKTPGTPLPTIKKIFKIIEGKNFLQPYDRYKKAVGNEVFRYHGTRRTCTLGSGGNTQLCANAACPLCSILKTSFQTSFANPNGCFGPGIYSSSASNQSYGFTAGGAGAIILTKVVLGNIRYVSAPNEVMDCPPGFNSVVWDYLNGALNETIVYSDDAIRPVFLITF